MRDNSVEVKELFQDTDYKDKLFNDDMVTRVIIHSEFEKPVL